MTQSVPMTAAALLPLLSLGLAILVQTGVICFFIGKMSQRMTSAEKRLAEQDAIIEKKIGDQSALIEKVVRLEVKMEHITKSVEKVCHTLENVSHQLSNMSMNRSGKLYEIGPAE